MGANKVQKGKCGSDVKLRTTCCSLQYGTETAAKNDSFRTTERWWMSTKQCKPRDSTHDMGYETKKGSKNKEKVIQQLRNQRGHWLNIFVVLANIRRMHNEGVGYKEKLLNANLPIIANWLAQTGFFLDHEGTFCNQGKSYAFPPKIRLYTSCRFPLELRWDNRSLFTGKVVVLLVSSPLSLPKLPNYRRRALSQSASNTASYLGPLALSELQEEACRRIFPTSLTGDFTSEIAEDDWERGCIIK